MADLSSAFYHMAEPGGAEQPFIPGATEAEVRALVEAFESQLVLPFAPHVGAHGLVFGEWGHGKTQVLYRLANHLDRQRDRCLVLVVIAEQMSPYHLTVAGARHAELGGGTVSVLRDAATQLFQMDPRDASAPQLAAFAFANYAATSGRAHAAILFDEAQTVEGVSFQQFLQELRQAFNDRAIVLHTLQCHSLVSLDRAAQLAQDIEWLQGPTVRKVHLPSLREEEAFELFRSRLATVAPEIADRFIGPGIARTICRLLGGNPRGLLTLAQELAREVGSARPVSGDDLVRVCERQPGETAGTSLFMRQQFQRLLDFLPQVWQAPLGTRMANELSRNIGAWFGEDATMELSATADRLGVDVSVFERNLRRRVDGIRLFDMGSDELGSTTLHLSFECRHYLSKAFMHGGDFNEKQVQFDCLMVPTLQQRPLADALRLTELGEVSPPIRLGTYPDGAQIRAYEIRYQVPGTSYTNSVLLAPTIGAHWPVDAARTAIDRLRRGSSARVIILDLVVRQSWQDWVAECRAANVELPLDRRPPDLVRIDADAWGSILPPPADTVDQPGARAAVLCAALRGAEHARQNRLPKTDDQERARRGILDGVGNLLPATGELCYLPNQEEQRYLDLPQWAAGALSLQALREALGFSDLAARQLRDLVPAWLEEVSTRKWSRRRWAETPLAQAVMNILRAARTAQTLEQIKDKLSGRLALPHPERLDGCLPWLMNKLAAEGLVDIDVLGAVKFRDVAQEIRDRRTTLRRRRSELGQQLLALDRLSHDRWSAIADRAQAAIKGATAILDAAEARGPAALPQLDDALEELRQTIAEIARQVSEADRELKRLVDDMDQWVIQRRQQVGALHPAWREVLGLEKALGELERFVSGVKRLAQSTSDGEQDRLGQATIEYQRARVWSDRLDKLLQDGGEPEGVKRDVAKAILSGNFTQITVTFEEGNG